MTLDNWDYQIIFLQNNYKTVKNWQKKHNCSAWRQWTFHIKQFEKHLCLKMCWTLSSIILNIWLEAALPPSQPATHLHQRPLLVWQVVYFFSTLNLVWWVVPVPSNIVTVHNFPKAGKERAIDSMSLGSECHYDWANHFCWGCVHAQWNLKKLQAVHTLLRICICTQKTWKGPDRR